MMSEIPNTTITITLSMTDEEGDVNSASIKNSLPYQIYEADILKTLDPSNLDAFLKTAVIDNLSKLMRDAKLPKEIRKEMISELKEAD